MYMDFLGNLEPVKLVAIDTGIKKTLGCVFLEITLKPEIYSFLKKYTKTFFKSSEGKKKLFYELFVNKNAFVWVPFHKVYDFSENNRLEVVKDILDTAKYNSFDLQTFFVIEDFLFFNLDNKKSKMYAVRPASWFTVAKMQRAIGFLHGYLTSLGYKVEILSPRAWKSYVDPYYVTIANRLVKDLKDDTGNTILKIKKTEFEHLKSAVGLGLGYFTSMFISHLGNLCKRKLSL